MGTSSTVRRKELLSIFLMGFMSLMIREYGKWKEDEDALAGMKCVGQDTARNEISQVGENPIRVRRATSLQMYPADVKIYFRFMVNNILKRIGRIDHEHR